MIKKIAALVLALLMMIAACAGCAKNNNDHTADASEAPVEIPVNTEEAELTAEPTAEATEEATPEATQEQAEKVTPEPTDKPTDKPTDGPGGDQTQKETPAPTAAPTAAPTTAPQTYDYSVFADCAFVGNSVFDGLFRYAIITNSHFFTKTGLNINTVYTATTSTGTVPVIDELNTGSYRGVLLMFGQNECGWPSLDTFLNKYEQLLQDVWQRQPGCKIFITGVPPITKAVSDTNTNGITNDRLNYINEHLQQIADRTENAYYITVPSVMIGPDGALPEAASGGDGIHLNLTYYRYWADHICASVSSVLG